MKKLSKEDFIHKAVAVHGDLYTYDDVDYINGRTKVVIKCREHGDFLQLPTNHINGAGCLECAIYARARGLAAEAKTEFVTKASKKHSSQYSYAKVEYVRSTTQVTITCPIHGDFEQRPKDHLNGVGCPECAREVTGWTYTSWEDQGNRSTAFNGFSMYTIECWNDEERFIKIGKTFVSIARRFSGKKKLPYKYRVLDCVYGTAREISELEHEKHREFKEYAYTPLIHFKGAVNECFSTEIMD